MTRLAAAALLLLPLAACDTGGSDAEKAVYYVAGVRYTLNASRAVTTATSRVAIEYMSPTGVKRDTISGALVTWSKMFDRDELPELRLKATNLSARDTMKQPNFVSVTLRVGGEVVAQDTSATMVEVRQ
jgi:hypothetical protein